MSNRIWTPPEKRLILPSRPKLSGWYKLEAVRSDGTRRTLADWFPNLITTNGANLIGNSGSALAYCSVGSGNTSPTLADVSLQTRIATTGAVIGQTNSAQSSPPYYGTYTLTYVFPTGAAAGNLSEVGVGSGSTGLSLFSRALILDSFGSPTTITVLSSEVLYVTYQLRNYVPTADVIGTIVIAGVTYAYTLRAAGATNPTQWSPSLAGFSLLQCAVYNGSIGTITGGPSGTAGGNDSYSIDPYSSGSFLMSGTVGFSIGSGNVPGGISAALINFNGYAEYQISFSPSIPKDASHVLTLSFSNSWAINTP